MSCIELPVAMATGHSPRVLQVVGLDAELGLQSPGDHVIVMAVAHVRVDADADASVREEPSVPLEL